MSGSGENTDGDIGFQIAPMIDLILVMLVFFMSTVALREVENELGISLPGKGLADTDAKITVDMNITIENDGSVLLNSQPVAEPSDRTLETLRSRLLEQVELFDDKIPVIITPQPDVPHARVIDVLDSCMAARVRNVTFGS